jgi:hypothetical protein
MMKSTLNLCVSAALAAVLIPTVGCRELPGSDEAQGATIGGLAGAATGAVIAGEDNRLLGALIGGALGAGGGYVVGANADKISGKDRDGAREAVRKAETNPATAEQVRTATTADANSDGFVTMDEVVAMENAGLTADEMLERLRATGQVFELTSEQEEYLRRNGVPNTVISQMPDLNQEAKERLLPGQGDVISRPSTGGTEL